MEKWPPERPFVSWYSEARSPGPECDVQVFERDLTRALWRTTLKDESPVRTLSCSRPADLARRLDTGVLDNFLDATYREA